MKDTKTEFLKIRISKELKKDFYNYIRSKKKNMSKTLIALIKLFVKSNDVRKMVLFIEKDMDK